MLNFWQDWFVDWHDWLSVPGLSPMQEASLNQSQESLHSKDNLKTSTSKTCRTCQTMSNILKHGQFEKHVVLHVVFVEDLWRMNQGEKSPLRITGHSLGGSMAMLAAFQLSKNYTIKDGGGFNFLFLAHLSSPSCLDFSGSYWPSLLLFLFNSIYWNLSMIWNFLTAGCQNSFH